MKRILTLLFSLVCLQLSAKSYYVKTGGNDAAAGTSDALAWAHHPWMSSWVGTTVLVPGDIVYMKRGNSWVIANPTDAFMTTDETQNGTKEHKIITTAYGTGTKPLIKISTDSDYPVIRIVRGAYLTFDNLEIEHNSSVYKSGRQTGFELVLESNNIVITNCDIHEIPMCGIWGMDDSYNITVGDTLATKIATRTGYSNNIYNFGYAGVILMGSNPDNLISNFKVYYNYIHDAKQTNAGDNEYGIAFTANAGCNSWPKYAIARFNRVENLRTWHGLDIHGGSYIYFTDNYIYNFGRNGISFGMMSLGSLPPTCDNIFIERNIIEQPASGWVPGYSQFVYIFRGIR